MIPYLSDLLPKWLRIHEGKNSLCGRMGPQTVIRRMAAHTVDNATLIHPTKDRFGKQLDKQG